MMKIPRTKKITKCRLCHNKKLTQYCSIHRNWEDIKAIWSKNNQVDFKWQYHVSRHKKRF